MSLALSKSDLTSTAKLLLLDTKVPTFISFSTARSNSTPSIFSYLDSLILENFIRLFFLNEIIDKCLYKLSFLSLKSCGTDALLK